MADNFPIKAENSQPIIRNHLRNYQDKLTCTLQQLDGKSKFIEDKWERKGLGEGRTRVITDGNYFEQGGVNFSEISGNKVPDSLIGRHPELEGHDFWGAGVSMVLHPYNPFCPTVHLNYRYFEAGPVWWFAGGCDLTPYYPFIEDCEHWHRTLKEVMDKHDPKAYPAFKYWCDEYFFNHHRNESRGIGGTFYDYQDGKPGCLVKADFARRSELREHPAQQLTQHAKTWEELFNFQKDNAESFFSAYLPIAQKRKSLFWDDRHRQFQLYRRGRYVEFNLLYDRGTAFGLQSKGRTESILMSLPPLVRWQYDYVPAPNTIESELTTQYLHRHINWLPKVVLFS